MHPGQPLAARMDIISYFMDEEREFVKKSRLNWSLDRKSRKNKKWHAQKMMRHPLSYKQIKTSDIIYLSRLGDSVYYNEKSSDGLNLKLSI